MGALLILVLMTGYLWLVYQIARRVPRWAKPLVVIAAVLVVSADGYLGRKKLEQLCEEQGGLHIYETVEGVEGFGLGKKVPTPSWIESNGYLFVEGKYHDGVVDRLSIDTLGNIIKENNVSPKSKYQLITKLSSDTPKNYYMWKITLTSDDGGILAKAINFGYRGGWVERFIGALYASRPPVALCSNSIDYTELLVWKTTILPQILIPREEN